MTLKPHLVQKTPETSEYEIRVLRREVADLASALNNIYGLRLIRLFNLYRHMRYQATEMLLSLSNWKKVFKLGATNQDILTSYHFDRSIPDQTYDVIFMSCGNWQWRYQRPQHLANQWANHGYRVFFLSPDFRPYINPVYANSKKQYSARPVRPNVFEVHLAGPRQLQPLSKRMLDFDKWKLVRASETLLKDFQIEQGVCVVELPFWAPLALELRKRFGWKIVYDLIDRFYGVFPTAHSMLSEEVDLLIKADLVVATARLLQSEAKIFNSNVAFIPNAAELEHFTQTVTRNLCGELNVNGPIIGYFGNLAPWFDVELIYKIASNHPEWTFILIGSGIANIKYLAKLANVKLLGEIPYQSLPVYLNKFDVCIIPFKVLPVTSATDPVKLYEYLAAGKPVVATNLPEMSIYSDLVYLADTSSEFEYLIDLALSEDTETKRLQRIEFARDNDWLNRFRRYDRAIMNLFKTRVATVQSHKTKAVNHHTVSYHGPIILDLEPSVVRVNTGFQDPEESFGKLWVRGRNLTTDCAVLVDEQPILTHFVNTNELICQIPRYFYKNPGCLMVSVIEQNTWKQSNRRILLIEGS